MIFQLNKPTSYLSFFFEFEFSSSNIVFLLITSSYWAKCPDGAENLHKGREFTIASGGVEFESISLIGPVTSSYYFAIQTGGSKILD